MLCVFGAHPRYPLYLESYKKTHTYLHWQCPIIEYLPVDSYNLTDNLLSVKFFVELHIHIFLANTNVYVISLQHYTYFILVLLKLIILLFVAVSHIVNQCVLHCIVRGTHLFGSNVNMLYIFIDLIEHSMCASIIIVSIFSLFSVYAVVYLLFFTLQNLILIYMSRVVYLVGVYVVFISRYFSHNIQAIVIYINLEVTRYQTSCIQFSLIFYLP